MSVTQFRKTKDGPEKGLESQVVNNLSGLLPDSKLPSWTAGSVPIGAGHPDIVVVAYRPEIYALCDTSISTYQILGYLRAVRCANVATISERVSLPKQIVIRCVNDLVKFEVLNENTQVYSLSEIWKDILPEITTIEVKVADWKRAIMQAARNRIFAHRSYVALPQGLASRVARDPLFGQFGVGILGISPSSGVSVIKRARKMRPKVWDYYYKLAELTALYTGELSECHSL